MNIHVRCERLFTQPSTTKITKTLQQRLKQNLHIRKQLLTKHKKLLRAMIQIYELRNKLQCRGRGPVPLAPPWRPPSVKLDSEQCCSSRSSSPALEELFTGEDHATEGLGKDPRKIHQPDRDLLMLVVTGRMRSPEDAQTQSRKSGRRSQDQTESKQTSSRPH